MSPKSGPGDLSPAEAAFGHVGRRRDATDPEGEDEEIEITEFGDRLDAAMKIMRGEAGELEARDDVDRHLQDVIEGLRHHADEIEEFLQEEYYR